MTYTKEQIMKVKEDMINGELKPILQKIKEDDTLDLEISENHIWIYYRGGGIMKIIPPSNNEMYYKFEIDKGFLANSTELARQLIENNNPEFWVSKIPALKTLIDKKRTSDKKELEKQCQQLIVRENNYIGYTKDVANRTDYFIADIEYPINTLRGNEKKEGRVDFLALKLPANPVEKKLKNPLRLALIELKYLEDQAGRGEDDNKDSTLSRHKKDIYEHLTSESSPEKAIEKMADYCKFALSTKYSLGLVMNSKEFDDAIISRERFEFIIILANYRPSQYHNLLKELKKVLNSKEYQELKDKYCDFKLAYSSMMGYALYEDCMITLEEFVENN